MNAINTATVMHAAIIVENLDDAVDAWTALLGAEPVFMQVADTRDDEYRGSPTSARCRQAIFDLGGFQIELMEAVGEPSVWADYLNEQGAGLHHIAFSVRGMEEGIEQLGDLDAPLVQRGEFPNGRYAYFDQSRFGAMIELLEFDPGHPQHASPQGGLGNDSGPLG